jgi:hypothetical protein
MTTRFSDLRNNSTNFDALRKQVEDMSKTTYEKDDTRFWQPTVDKAGNGYAVIRFLPPPKGETLAWARVWNHGFQGPSGRWYIENSLTTIGQSDPVSELNSELWNSGIESNKDIARAQKRRLNYISNILVVKDQANPENNGKVFLFKYGKKIFDKIKQAMNPEFDVDEPINPFDFWNGANFRMKIRKVEGYRNYDLSVFESPSPIADSDDVMEEIWNQQHSLATFTDPKNFKTYEELKAKLDQVLRGANRPVTADSIDEDDAVDAPSMKSSPEQKKPTASSSFEEEDDDDDAVSYFEKLSRE